MTPLRIAMALPGMHRVNRGAETAFGHIAQGLAGLGHRVTVFGSGPARDGVAYHYQAVRCIARERFERWPKFPPLRSHYAWEEMTFAAGLLPRGIHSGNFDLTIGCSYPFVQWALRRDRRLKHLFITQNGDWMIQARKAEYRFFNCDGLVCTNTQYFERHRRRYRSALVPNGVDPSMFHPGPARRSDYGLPEDVPLVLMVSALIPSKNVTDGIAAVAAADGMFLALAGDGPCRDEVDATAARLLPGRYKRMNLPPDRMPGLYRCADVFLHASHDEASANVYLEALASGLPVVAHDWEVTQWTFEDRAILVDCGQVKRITAALERAMSERSQDFIERRRELISRRFTWDKIVLAYDDFLNSLLFVRSAQPAAASSWPAAPADLGVVVIGRNEGERLARCLAAAKAAAACVVYVDSGSTDQSPATPRRLDADAVVELDASKPFTAARGRNAGVEALLSVRPDAAFVQFIDGDCELQPGWLQSAMAALAGDPKLAAVAGRRRERFGKNSIYNRLMDMEWDTPVGPCKSIGGDAMFRLQAFNAVGGFDPSVAAGEEPQLCLRLRHAGWNLARLDSEMTLHDAAIHRFSQWWQRQIRGGYGALDVHSRFEVGGERLFAKSTRSAIVWGIGWPVGVAVLLVLGIVLAIAGRPLLGLALPIAGILAFAVQVLRIARGSRRRGHGILESLAWGFFTMLSKWAWLSGMRQYRRDRAQGKLARLIEYKQSSPDQGPAKLEPVR